MAKWLAHLLPEERTARRRKYRKAYKAAHPGRHNAQVSDWQRRNKEKRKAINQRYWVNASVKQKTKVRLRQYGLTVDAYEAMLAGQGGRCLICRRAFSDGKVISHIDHDHKTGNVRGILCHSCNCGLGHFREDIAVMVAAIKYLKKSEANIVMV